MPGMTGRARAGAAAPLRRSSASRSDGSCGGWRAFSANVLRHPPAADASPLISLRRPGTRGGTRLADPGGGLWAHARAFPLPRDEVRDGNCAVRAFRTRLRCLAPAARPHGPRDCPESVSSRDAVGCGTRIRPGYRRQAAAAPISPSVISEIWIRGPDSCVRLEANDEQAADELWADAHAGRHSTPDPRVTLPGEQRTIAVFHRPSR